MSDDHPVAPMTPEERTAKWIAYYERTANEPPRKSLLRALEFIGDALPGLAVDLGCGGGRDTSELLDRGWSVVAIDREPAAIARMDAITGGERAQRLRTVVAPLETVQIPSCSFVNASYSLPFCPPEHFASMWARVRDAIVPGGRFAGQFFGDRDEWRDNPELTFHTRAETVALFAGFEIEELTELDEDGTTSMGEAKHWHVFTVIARKPDSAPPSLLSRHDFPTLPTQQTTPMADTMGVTNADDPVAVTATVPTPHQLLRALEGRWRGVAKTYFEPGVLGDESEWRGTIRPILGGLYMLHEYEGKFDKTPHVGMAIVGYSTNYKRYEMTWVDTHHNGRAIMFAVGAPHDGRASVLGSYPDGVGGPDWGWRTEFEVRDANTIVINAYNITPTGEEALAIETVYRRDNDESASATTHDVFTQPTTAPALRSLVGEWEGTARTWFEPDVLGDESQWRGSIRLALNGLFVVHEYTGTLCREALAGMAIIGHNPHYDRYEMALVDNNHSASSMMFATGGTKERLPIAVLGSCPGYPGKPDWSWRTELEARDEQTLVITAYNISPEGEEAKAIETIYRRVDRKVQ